MLTKVKMRTYSVYLVVALLVLVSCSAIPKPGEESHKDSKDRTTNRTLNDAAHEIDEEHNAECDHEAFIGKDDARTFDDLSPEESRERLGVIVDTIDKDKDGLITESELKEWIQCVQKQHLIKDADREWANYNIVGNTLTWEHYKKHNFGSLTENTNEMQTRDQRLWKLADVNGDNELDKQEFMHFVHQEDSPHIKDLVVQDIDKDHDGFISLEEYISDMYSDVEQDGEEPSWVQEERLKFSNYRDKNDDGLLDKEEIKQWIVPDYDHAEAETTRLIHEADDDKDGKLSKKEILDHHELFAESLANI